MIITPAAADVVHQLEKWENRRRTSHTRLGQKDQERGEPADPHPATSRKRRSGARVSVPADYANDEERLSNTAFSIPDAGMSTPNSKPVTRICRLRTVSYNTHHAQPVQMSGSKAFIVSQWLKHQIDGIPAQGNGRGQRLSETSAAEFCARQRPASHTKAAPARAGSRRRCLPCQPPNACTQTMRIPRSR